MPVVTTRTLNPLPFDALEPKRFEDLIRQLAYDFRQWRMLEATGRAGSDDGYDARGYEIVGDFIEVPTENPSGTDDNEVLSDASPDRLWLIQCKRERTIPPARMRQHLAGISDTETERLYGIIFAAACDVSKKTRDELFVWARARGISEVHIWGKGEIEDQLFQPKNDHLLFAYFNISLQIRRRSAQTALRARLAMKRQSKRVLEKASVNFVLLRDPTDDRYPYEPSDEDERVSNPIRWRMRRFDELDPRGIVIEAERCFAYVADDGFSWDCVESVNDALPDHWEDPWSDTSRDRDLRGKVWKFWSSLPEENRAWLVGRYVIPYDQIMAIDEDGDSIAKVPHIYLDRYKRMVLGTKHLHLVFRKQDESIPADQQHRVSFFPEEFPPDENEDGAIGSIGDQ